MNIVIINSADKGGGAENINLMLNQVYNLKNHKYQPEGMYNDNLFNHDHKECRKNLFLGKKFDYKLSVIDLLFVKGPESGFFINNF